MDTISYDKSYFNYVSFLKEIEEICAEPYHLYRELGLHVKAIKAKRLVRKTEKLNRFAMQSLYLMDFKNVLDLEKRVCNILELTNQVVKGCKECEYTKCKTIFSDVYFMPLILSFEKLLRSIQNSYNLNADDIFTNSDEYKINNDALKTFSDIWDYETPDEDKEIIFKYKAELMRV